MHYFFSNGYLANCGVIQAITHSSDIIYQDKSNHASLYDAANLSGAKLKRYRHNDLKHLKTLLETAEPASQKFIVSESFFSTTGDAAPLSDLASLAQQHQAHLMIDHAHGLGIFEAPSHEEVPILVCPLGKAIGGFGAIVAGSKTLIESLIQFARTCMYTTALPPVLSYALLTSLGLTQQESWRKEKLFENILYFKQTAQELGLSFLVSDHPIQALPIGDNFKALYLHQYLYQEGFWVSIMRPPSVAPGLTLLRMSLNASHEKPQIFAFLKTLKNGYETICT